MSDEKTVIYMVTAGQYSDHRVCGIYSTRELAERAKGLYAADNSIEELELNEMPDAPPGLFRYQVHMDKDGNSWPCILIDASELWLLEKDWQPSYIENKVQFNMWAADEKHAIKIANERRLMLLASAEWLTDPGAWVKARFG